MNLRLIRFDYQITQDELNENFLYKLNEEELNWALKIETELPNISKSEGDIFDVFLVDEINLKSIKKLLDKYDIEYVTSDVSSDVPNNISESFKKEIDEFILDNLTIDTILDRISEVGIDNISPVEKYYLELFNKSIFF